MDKSHVGIGYDLCPICCKEHNETILLNRNLKETLERKNFTGWSLCEEHKKKYDENFVALIGIDEEKSSSPYDLHNIHRTGQAAHIASHVFTEIFDVEIPDNPFRLMFCPDEVFDMLNKIPVQK